MSGNGTEHGRSLVPNINTEWPAPSWKPLDSCFPKRKFMHRSQHRDLVLADRKTKILAVLVSTTPVGTGVWEGGLGCEDGEVEVWSTSGGVSGVESRM